MQLQLANHVTHPVPGVEGPEDDSGSFEESLAPTSLEEPAVLDGQHHVLGVRCSRGDVPGSGKMCVVVVHSAKVNCSQQTFCYIEQWHCSQQTHVSVI